MYKKTQTYKLTGKIEKKGAVSTAIIRTMKRLIEENEMEESFILRVNSQHIPKDNQVIVEIDYQVSEVYNISMAEEATKKQIFETLIKLGYRKNDIREVRYRDLSPSSYEKVWVVKLHNNEFTQEYSVKMGEVNLKNRVEREIGLEVYFNFL